MIEKSTLFKMIEREYVYRWREQVETEDCNYFLENEKNSRDALLCEMTEQGKKLLTPYSLAIVDRLNFLHYNLQIKILNLGVQIGMELQKAAVRDDE